MSFINTGYCYDRISEETYMKLAGACQQFGGISNTLAFFILTYVAAVGPASYYGKQPYSGRRILEGIKAGEKANNK